MPGHVTTSSYRYAISCILQQQYRGGSIKSKGKCATLSTLILRAAAANQQIRGYSPRARVCRLILLTIVRAPWLSRAVYAKQLAIHCSKRGRPDPASSRQRLCLSSGRPDKHSGRWITSTCLSTCKTRVKRALPLSHTWTRHFTLQASGTRSLIFHLSTCRTWAVLRIPTRQLLRKLSTDLSVSSYDGPYMSQYPSPPAAPPPQGALMGPPSMLRGPAPRAGSAGSGSPPGSNHTSPGQETTSEDSDDSTPLSQLVGGVKRPSPEPLMDNGGKTAKKAKMPKKKKKRDPNEPQKPVSAYALFFRDTQAAIKGQNPNASFGEVSKIVASMWDGLEADHKNVYKKKTEAAKKEYLKALAAYRASLVSKGSLSPLQKKSPLLTSLMEGGSPHNQYMAMSPPQGMLNAQQQVWPNMHPMAQSPSMMPQQPLQQTMMQQHSPPQQMMMASAPVVAPSYTADLMSAPPPSLSSPASSGGGMMDQQGPMPGGASHQRCIRNGCPNPAIESHDWDREYCSSECVVSHCRDVFTAWVAQRQVANTNTFVK
ncbi:uncharacterized protein LOC119177026 isoform X4 [Rhipicephalus microplus]|uniref:uncharacterized protein LOC119177026 isoform X4 n=1 Tax=Rhipicephalus microplus TaxID=6941 RepID=UPI003F6A81FA